MSHNILGDKKKSNFDDNLANIVNEIYDKMPDEPLPGKVQDSDGPKVHPRLRIIEKGDSYELENIAYSGDFCSFTWDKSLLDEEKIHTQDEWIKITNKLPCMPVYFNTFLALYENKDGPQAELIEKVRQMFAQDFEDHWMMTNTRIIYRPKGLLDSVCQKHEDIQLDSNFDLDFIGKSGNINSEIDFRKPLVGLIGGNNIGHSKICKVFEWVNNKKTYLSRNSSKLVSQYEKSVLFYIAHLDDAYGSTFNIRISGTCADFASARGVVISRNVSLW